MNYGADFALPKPLNLVSLELAELQCNRKELSLVMEVSERRSRWSTNDPTG
jgi:hypothetical protein